LGQAKVPKTAPQLRGVNVVRFANNGALIEMSEPIDLPPEIEQVADLLGKQRPEVRVLFRYALVLAMIDDEKAHMTGTRIENNRKYLTVRSIAGDVIEILRPPLTMETEWRMRE
jgi:hypothetical protein